MVFRAWRPGRPSWWAVAVVTWGEYSKPAPGKGESRPLSLPHVSSLFVVSLKTEGLILLLKTWKETSRI